MVGGPLRARSASRLPPPTGWGKLFGEDQLARVSRKGGFCDQTTRTVRIVAIGGSTTFGTGNGEDDTYPALLERKRNSGGRPVRYEVINAGVAGYYSYQQVLRVRKELLALQPDAAIVFEGWNDFWCAYRGMQLLQRKAARALKRGPDADLIARYETAAGNDAVYESYQKNLEAMVDALGEHGVRVLLVRFPALIQDGLDERERTAVATVEPSWKRYASFVKAQQKLWARMGAVSGKCGVEVIDLDATFGRQQGVERARLFTDVIHFTPAGNEIIAEAVMTRIAELRGPGRSGRVGSTTCTEKRGARYG